MIRDSTLPRFSIGQRVVWNGKKRVCTGTVSLIVRPGESPTRTMIRHYGHRRGMYAFRGESSVVRLYETYLVRIDDSCNNNKSNVFQWKSPMKIFPVEAKA